MRAWMVRAGSDGEREEPALTQGRAIAGWFEVPDIGACRSRDELRDVIAAAYGDTLSRAVLGNWTGQLWRFLHEMAVGDVIAMPLKTRPDELALGRITGAYFFAADDAPGFRHSRPVDWVEPIPRANLGADLLASLGSLLTICELARNDAANRLAVVAGGGRDPGASTEDSLIPDDLVGQAPLELGVRTLLGMWGYRRRSAGIVAEITGRLAGLGLLAIPSIEYGSIESTVKIVPAPGSSDSGDLTSTPDEEEAEASADAVIGGEIRYAVSTMPTARCDVESVHPGDSLSAALTRMALKDYSQLAVVDDQCHLLGGVTWESIALALTSGQPTDVGDAMISVPSALPDDELLVQAEVIYQRGFVFVRDASGSVQGVITSADLTRRFGDDHRPVVLLEEIERRIAHRINKRCNSDDIKAAGVKPPTYGMTMGTYVQILKSEALWGLLGWSGLDRLELVGAIDQVRLVRNQLAHFSPDPITPEEVQLLERTLRMLRLVTSESSD